MKPRSHKRSVQKVAATAPAALAQLLHSALSLHQQGKLDQAEALYRQALIQHPAQPDALHYLGVIAHQRGDHTTASRLIRQAIGTQPLPDMYQNLAVILTAAGQREAAIGDFWTPTLSSPTWSSLLVV
jgi:Flp pilus assembly protein TadD